uniref:Uncharacterized protein n=1 Tax=Magallana gigas TaxID=29159 RepID=K1QRZ1_MAGGI
MVDKEKIMEEGMKKYFLQKAVISNEGTKNSEFEVADSQDVTADEDYHRSKKKASDVTRAILV